MLLVVGLVAASQSGNIVRIGTAHPAAIVAWRLVLATIIMAAVAGSRMGDLARIPPKLRLLVLANGAVFAGHLVAFVTAVQHTTVANAMVFFGINPLVTAFGGRLFFGERLSGRLGIAIALGFLGLAIIGIEDFHLGMDSLYGDAMALLASLLFSAYFLLGKRIRPELDTRAYVVGIYGAAAVVAFGVLMAEGEPLVDYDAQTWVCFVAMAIVPTALGHTGLNAALGYIDVSRISTLILVEPALAGIVALFAWDEPLGAHLVVGWLLSSLAVVALVGDQLAKTRPRAPRATG